MSKHGLLPLIVIAAAAGVPASTGQRAAGDWTVAINSVASPAAPDSGQPQLTVSNRGVVLSWIERAASVATLKFAERTASGWSAPVSVASGADWFVNWADVPSVVRLTDGTLAAHWLQKSGAGRYAYDVRLSFSKDNGKTWTPSVTPHHDGTQTEHGFASLFQMPGTGAGLGLAWLDGRAMGGGGHAVHVAGASKGHAGGAMSLRFTTFDREGKQTAEVSIDPRVCECCPTTAAVTSDGPIVAFRNRSAADVRDIQVSRFENGRWTEPASVHEDGWRIGACPVNGPALSARGRSVAIAWFTAVKDQPRAYVAFSNDAGRTFGTPVRVDDAATLGRVDVELLPDGSAVVSYIEYADQRSRFTIRRIDPSGARSPAITVSGVGEGRSSGYPRIAAHKDELVLAWLDPAGSSRVNTAVATLPR